MIERGGFDAVVGNPAFLHSKKITTAYGKNYRDFLQSTVAAGVTGDADLAADTSCCAKPRSSGRPATSALW